MLDGSPSGRRLVDAMIKSVWDILESMFVADYSKVYIIAAFAAGIRTQK